MGVGLNIPSTLKAESSIVEAYAAERLRKEKVLERLVHATATELTQLSLFCNTSTYNSSRDKLLFTEN